MIPVELGLVFLFELLEKVKSRDNQRVADPSLSNDAGDIFDGQKAYLQFLRLIQL